MVTSRNPLVSDDSPSIECYSLYILEDRKDAKREKDVVAAEGLHRE